MIFLKLIFFLIEKKKKIIVYFCCLKKKKRQNKEVIITYNFVHFLVRKFPKKEKKWQLTILLL